MNPKTTETLSRVQGHLEGYAEGLSIKSWFGPPPLAKNLRKDAAALKTAIAELLEEKP